ncbi:phosphonate metabolism protein/1,5-bisphosphokinase (PRPP-forming) PhnN [Chitinolyticbacter meiyuanensis]|uniref:phosphonate metabolism protein/1,5-bisphosphokinase (PRPP-forming) PhnN n=1 Tax=Chitinolyticbacter meiyuanensis TaxID=682798 RepID=UPI0011E5FC41|nr:phosphonate metabolism protein/1,5-bisphosphokinase (PRPP-forming) PhnN [Chitinolyticbacter meiyuanensis]
MSGRLIMVVGPSGAGKDSVIGYARQALGCNRTVRFARRYITRPATAGGEDHFAMADCEFQDWLEHGRFALAWDSHGLHYGIGTEIDAWLAGGLTVVVNGSRAHLAEAQQRYPELEVVLISASPATLATRLAARGRESADEITARLAREAPLPSTLHISRIANDGALTDAGEALLRLLRGA